MNSFTRICTAFLLFALFLAAESRASQQDAINSLPAILCILLCEDAPATEAPALAPVSGSATLFKNVPSSAIVFTNSGGREITSCTSSPALPAGLMVSIRGNGSSCQISGTPLNISSEATYSITATNALGSSSADINLQVLPSFPELADITGTNTLLRNQAAAPLIFTNTGGGAITACSVSPPLPVGLLIGVSSNAQSCAITGTPSVDAAAAAYQVTATNQFGDDSAAITIEVVPSLPELEDILTVQTLFTEVAIAPIVFSNTGAETISNCSVSPPLPAGLAVSTSGAQSCQITGTPVSELSLTSFSVTATNGFGSDSASVTIEVEQSEPRLSNIVDTVSLRETRTAPAVVFNNTAGGAITLCAANPALPTGLVAQVTADAGSCEIAGTPTVQAAEQSYTITATNQFGSDGASVNLEVLDPQILLSGTVTYDLVPDTNQGGVQLDYDSITQEPVRFATVQLLDASDTVLQTTSTDDLGNYSFSLANDATVRVRVRAELLKTTGAGRYDVQVIDNTSNGALYTLAEASATATAGDSVRNLNAPSGYDTNVDAYTSTRASGPFAMLDSIYGAISDMLAVDNDAVFPELKVNWSVNNRSTGGNIAIGNIGTSFYTNGQLFILGNANDDTDEFDDHIIVHEWGHYFEDNLSRSDSTGGPHSGGDRLDMRLAFGEGFGNALSGIITDDPLYIDTRGANQANGFTINVESNPAGANRGWYNESSVQSLLYDFYDSNNDGADQISLGLAPIYNVLVNEQRDTPFFTSIFSFVTALKANNAASIAEINQVVNAQNINGNDIQADGSTELNDAGGAAQVLPIYTNLNVGATTNICTNTPFNGSSNNKLANNRYLTFSIANAGVYNISVVRNGPNPESDYGTTDPDFRVQRGRIPASGGFSGAVGQETASNFLAVGDYVMSILEFNITSPTNRRGIACFDVNVSEQP